ncbi:hypothetical protein, partial [Pontiella sp.]|uniref:hypothetical protein n=1 Tax=Pontiella sp. TaxID=2837462 RepID=UPI003563E865
WVRQNDLGQNDSVRVGFGPRRRKEANPVRRRVGQKDKRQKNRCGWGRAEKSVRVGFGPRNTRYGAGKRFNQEKQMNHRWP